MVLETERLRLTLNSLAELLAQIEQLPPEHRAEVSPAWVERVLNVAEPDPWWHGFAIRLRDREDKLGDAGFKGPPNEAGVVEIAYGLSREHQRKGYATEAAAALVRFAFAQPNVQLVCAHTKEDNPASRRVLEKCGFRFVGNVNDPDDGLVCRWEISKGEFVGK